MCIVPPKTSPAGQPATARLAVCAGVQRQHWGIEVPSHVITAVAGYLRADVQVATPSVPLASRYIPDSHDPQHRYPSARELLYGTSAGTVVQLLMEADSARQGFTLPNTKKLGAISAIYSGGRYRQPGSCKHNT